MNGSSNSQRLLRPAGWLATTLLLFCTTGASCPQMLQQYTQPAPRVLPPQPSLEQVITAVNTNSDKIRSLNAPQGSISVAGFPSLRAKIAMQQPNGFRLQASTSLTGEELDLGSNDQIFWLWIRRNQPPAFYFCRHDQFASSAARQIFPVEPRWLNEALGVVHFDPSGKHSGPTVRPAGGLEVVTKFMSNNVELTKVTIIDEARAWVLEQHLYDPQNQRLATAITNQYRRDSLSGAYVPRHVEIQWPPAGMTMKLDLGEVQVNTVDETGKLFIKPEIAGYQNVDLADPNIHFGPPPR